MRNAFANKMTELSQIRDDLVLLSGDIGNRMFDKFKSIAPERFINCGIAESNMMSVASGLALTGMRPVIYTITPFTTSRCFEQIKIGAAYHNANIVIVGTGSGLSYSELGPTHHSLEDMGILNTIPNLRILAPCDPFELCFQLEESLNLQGPTYIRIGKKGEPNLIKETTKLKIGKANIINNGSDFLLIGVGPILNEALKAAEILKSEYQISLCVVSFGGIEPIHEDFLRDSIAADFRGWITLEEHGFAGGLGSKINNWILKNSNSNLPNIINLSAPKEFIHNLGNQQYVRNELGLNSSAIVEKIINI